MDYKIFTYVLAVLAFLCFLNAADYWEDYRRYYWQFTSQAQARYGRHIRRNAVLCVLWGIFWTVIAVICWFIPQGA